MDYGQSKWRSMLTSCINGIAKNFKDLRYQSMDRLDQTLPLPQHTRRILDNWIMEAKEALSLWSPAEEAMEADIPLAGVSSEEEAKDVASRLTDVSEQIEEAMVTNPDTLIELNWYPASIVAETLLRRMGRDRATNLQLEVLSRLKTLRAATESRLARQRREVQRLFEVRRQEQQGRARNTPRQGQQHRPRPEGSQHVTTAAEHDLKKYLLKLVHNITGFCSKEGISSEVVDAWKESLSGALGLDDHSKLSPLITDALTAVMKVQLFGQLQDDLQSRGVGAFNLTRNKPSTWVRWLKQFPHQASTSSKRPHSPESRAQNETHPKVMKRGDGGQGRA